MTKTDSSKTDVILIEVDIQNQIYQIRELNVMLDRDLADLYGVETKQLKRQVRRNIERFPKDFMFELTSEEHRILRSQFGTLKQGGHSKYPPMAFTEQGVAMLRKNHYLHRHSILLTNRLTHSIRRKRYVGRLYADWRNSAHIYYNQRRDLQSS